MRSPPGLSHTQGGGSSAQPGGPAPSGARADMAAVPQEETELGPGLKQREKQKNKNKKKAAPGGGGTRGRAGLAVRRGGRGLTVPPWGSAEGRGGWWVHGAGGGGAVLRCARPRGTRLPRLSLCLVPV